MLVAPEMDWDGGVVWELTVTVTIPTRNVRVSKTTRLFVTARPMVNEPDRKTSNSKSGLRRTRSPRGDKSNRPVAYLSNTSASVGFMALNREKVVL